MNSYKTKYSDEYLQYMKAIKDNKTQAEITNILSEIEQRKKVIKEHTKRLIIKKI